MRDETTQYEQTYIPQVSRLDLPLRSVVNLRRVAAELRGLADRLDFLSRDPDDAPHVLFAAWQSTRRTNRNLAKIRRPGRPKKRTESLRWMR
jgi:hypothetical protein